MKFNKLTFYKVPFDNSYANVVDYRTYIKNGSILSNEPLNTENITESRDYYFNSLTKDEITLSEHKSIKINDNKSFISVLREYTTIMDFNYVILENTTLESGVDKLYCFVTGITSANDGTNASSIVNIEIDYWTQYITTILLNLPNQYEEYGHQTTTLNNVIQDDRLPDDFLYNHSYSPFYGTNAIIWIEMKYDGSSYDFSRFSYPGGHESEWANIIDHAKSINGADTAYRTIYIPFGVVSMENEILSFEVIKGIYNKDIESETPLVVTSFEKYNNYYDTTSSYFLSAFDSQYIVECNLTTITPFGILSADDWCKRDGYNDLYFCVTQMLNEGNVVFTPSGGGSRKTVAASISRVDIEDESFYFSTLPLFNDIKTYLVSAIGMVGRTTITNLPTENVSISRTLSESYISDSNASHSYNYDKEIKFLNNPYKKYSLLINGKEIDISLNATSSSYLPSVTISLQEMFSIVIRKISNKGANYDTTFFETIGNTGAFIVGKNQYNIYSETRMSGDNEIATGKMIVGIIGAITSIGAMGANLATGNLGGAFKSMGAGVASAGVASYSISEYKNNIKALKHTPSQYVSPSTNAIDHIYDTLPIVDTKTLNADDKEIVSSIWNQFGYPIKKHISFSMKRFWHDYKKIKNPSLPSITNIKAKETIYNILSNGVQIWHCNSYKSTYVSPISGQYISTIGDFSKNNPNKGVVTI